MPQQGRQGAGSEAKRQERWLRTRTTILEAAMSCLVEHGYAGLTMQRVQDAAGVSRGALTHHFTSMRELAAAAIEHVAAAQVQEVEVITAASVPSVERAVDALYDVTRRPTFIAGLELWVAARTDPVLSETLAPGARRTRHELQALFAALLEQPVRSQAVTMFVDGLLSLLPGLAVGAVLRERPDVERAVLHAWVEAVQHRTMDATS